MREDDEDEEEDAPLPELIMAAPAQAAPSDPVFTDDEDASGDPAPVFNFSALDAASDDDWSDDGRGAGREEAEEATGEYTGRFRVMAIPTKADPPSSCTRMRMDKWGRPKSPHPRRSLAALEEGEEGVDEDEDEDEVMKEVEEAEESEGREEDVLEGQDVELEEEVYQPLVEVREELALDEDEESYEARYEPAVIPVEEPDFVDLSVEVHEDSRTPSPTPFELLTQKTTEQYDFDVLMDDASDQDTLTEPDPDLADDFVSELSSKGKERAIVHSDVSPLPSTSTVTVEAPTEAEVEVVEEYSSVDVDEEEEDRSDEAVIDRELSVLPDDESEEEEEIEATTEVLQHAFHPPSESRSTDAEANPVRSPEVQPAAADEYDNPADGSDDDESDSLDDGVIKITSDDPLAAARAAAILRLHDYDCVPRILAKKRRHSHLDATSAIRDARRRSSLASGISKATSSTPKGTRRHTLGGMLGDKVFIPGSPALTIPELLKEAERSLDLENLSHSHSQVQDESAVLQKMASTRNEFVTPLKPADSFSWATPSFSLGDASTPVGREAGAWTRKEWKKLDSCLTDERLALGGGKVLVDVDSVDLEKVADRFFAQREGTSVLQEPDGLNREDVLRRARALQKKQQAGRVAPPTPSSVSLLSNTPCMSSFEKECTTPQGHASSVPPAPSPAEPERLQPPPQPHPQPRSGTAIPRPTFTTRVKGFFSSYLPVPSGSKAQPVKKPKPAQPGFPVPPPETFAKPRAPIHTPAPKPVPKPVPPRNSVQLNAVPPPKPSRIPRGKEQPRRLVDLHPAPPPPVDKPLRMDPSAKRRSSGGSVKDLILAFEGLGESSSSRPASVASNRGGSKLKERPLWRP
ncbi:uncharacterized protein B0H18DRAFT_439080 [Fomitopsis serialis]|uniref:uncharacterized protein n=1 Tax=Fomitopsis serialis TaxID=139415 RepID=UPI0020072504|nr:uncharacterized protein B0H18DRAFT_439080 [Neoantrodia serialis]KAH9924216.1 hypothetical protein B0H18DRAFT_439080 [Neoantrodia serialis]